MKRVIRKSNEGITLIALVVTIIVLLILAGVSLNLISGSEGILEEAKWSEYVTEYEKADEAKELYVMSQKMDEYNNGVLKWKKLFFSNVSYAKDVNDTMYPVDLEQRLSGMSIVETLRKSICYIENLEEGDIENEEKVDLYKVDFSLLNNIEVRREYVINVMSGMLYSIEGEGHKGKIYHTPRYGVISNGNIEEPDLPERPDVPDEPTEVDLKIHYTSGYDNSEYIQEIKKASEDITLIPMKFERENYTFVHWKDITSTKSSVNIDITEDTPEEVIEFEKQTGGYYDVVNSLINILDEAWEQDVIDIIETDKDYEPDPENEEAATDVTTQTKNDILEYFEDVKGEIQNKLGASMTIEGLAEWLILNEEYITNLQKYELEVGQDAIQEDDENAENIIYRDQESGIEISDSDMWLEAVWTNNPIILNANGGKIGEKETDILGVVEGEKYGKGLDIIPTRAGYIFGGWYTSGNVQQISEDIYNSANVANQTLYAHWEEENSANIVTVTYNANAGSCSITSEKRVKNTKYGTLPIATRENYALLGWFTSAAGETKITENTIVTENITLYAGWGNKLTMYYDLQGGEWRNKSKYKKMNPAIDTVYMGSSINFKMPERSATRKTTFAIKARTGYKFRGWYTKPNGEGEKIEKGSTITQTNNFTAYAYWEGKCTITYNANGGVFNKKTGVSVKTKQKYAQGTYPKMSKPLREGYTFEGWYDAPTGGNKITLNHISNLVTNDIILYAHWIDNIKPQKFTIAVENLTTEGFTMNLSKQIDLGTGIADVKYYVNESKSGSTYQESNEVTDLSNDMTRYVWAELIDGAGNVRKSTNYVKVVTAHVHTTSCYSNSNNAYSCRSTGSDKDTCVKIQCSRCGTVSDNRDRSYINTNYYYEIAKGHSMSYHEKRLWKYELHEVL